jgi:hypothetical protein
MFARIHVANVFRTATKNKKLANVFRTATKNKKLLALPWPPCPALQPKIKKWQMFLEL